VSFVAPRVLLSAPRRLHAGFHRCERWTIVHVIAVIRRVALFATGSEFLCVVEKIASDSREYDLPVTRVNGVNSLTVSPRCSKRTKAIFAAVRRDVQRRKSTNDRATSCASARPRVACAVHHSTDGAMQPLADSICRCNFLASRARVVATPTITTGWGPVNAVSLPERSISNSRKN